MQVLGHEHADLVNELVSVPSSSGKRMQVATWRPERSTKFGEFQSPLVIGEANAGSGLDPSP